MRPLAQGVISVGCGVGDDHSSQNPNCHLLSLATSSSPQFRHSGTDGRLRISLSLEKWSVRIENLSVNRLRNPLLLSRSSLSHFFTSSCSHCSHCSNRCSWIIEGLRPTSCYIDVFSLTLELCGSTRRATEFGSQAQECAQLAGQRLEVSRSTSTIVLRDQPDPCRISAPWISLWLPP